MKVSTVTERLEVRWIPVVDARGRERLVAHWVDPTARPVTARHAA